MNVRLKRAKELAGYAVQLTKDEGLGTMLARGAGFVKRRCFGKKARYLPTKKVLEAQRAELAGQTADSCGLPRCTIRRNHTCGNFWILLWIRRLPPASFALPMRPTRNTMP